MWIPMKTSYDVSKTLKPVENRYIILLIVLTGVLMSEIDGTIVTVALPTMTHYFNVGLQLSEWVITGYLLTKTSMLLIFGKTSEYFGKTKLFILGFLIFTVSSFACGISTTMGQLIFFRIIQALGASMAFSIAAAIIVDVFPKEEIGRALGYQIVATGIGIISGPSLGGFIVDLLGWNYIFFINVPIGIILLAASSKYLRFEEKTSKTLQMDWIGAMLFIMFTTSFILALDEISNGLGSNLSMIYIVIFALSLTAFMLRELKCQNPLFDLSMFKVRNFSRSITASLLFLVSVGMFTIIIPFYFQDLLKWTATKVGLVMMIIPLMLMVLSPVVGYTYDKYKLQNLPTLGLVIMGVSAILFGYMLAEKEVLIAIASTILLGAGAAVFMGPNNTDVMNSIPNKSNVLSSIASTFRNMGTVLGVSLASLLISQLNSNLNESMIKAIYIVGLICIISSIIAVNTRNN